MIGFEGLSKSFGGQVLFEAASLQMGTGERLGLIGRNGSGKTTLFRILLGEETPDSGAISIPRHYRIGHLSQLIAFTEATVLAEAARGLRPEQAHERYRVEQLLTGLGFDVTDFDRDPNSFSSGFQMRLAFARLLASEPELLLLDEPTNYLDILSIRWLTRYLSSWKGELILISHDRDFMDAVCTHTAMIYHHGLRKVSGDSDKLIEQIAQEEEVFRRTQANEERQRKHLQEYIDRFKAKASKAASARSKMKALARLPIRDSLEREADLEFHFHAAPFPAKTVQTIDDLHFRYTPEQRLIDDVSLAIAHGDRIAVIGKNGRGKSTLLKLLIGELAALNGTVKPHPSTRIAYFGQSAIDELHPANTVEQEIAAANPELTRTQIRSICGAMLFGGDRAEKKVSVLSGGERSRVHLGRILAQPANLLLLDEPTNHLDMQAIEALIESLDDFPGAVVIVTHNEMILQRVAERLVIFEQKGIRVFEGSYADFLDRIGWEEEQIAPPQENEGAGTIGPQPVSKKDLRRLRSQIITERSKVLTPIKQRMDAIEAEICTLESAIAEANEALITASQSGKGSVIAEHARIAREAQVRIDHLFEELAALHDAHDEHQRTFDAQLQELDTPDNG